LFVPLEDSDFADEIKRLSLWWVLPLRLGLALRCGRGFLLTHLAALAVVVEDFPIQYPYKAL